MTLFSISRRSGKPVSVRHKMDDMVFKSEERVCFKGQVFSAPMDWICIMKQLDDMIDGDTRIALPITGALLTARVRIHISAGLVELNKHMREATVRRDIVVRLITMHRNAGRKEYLHLKDEDIRAKANELTSSNEPAIPDDLVKMFDEDLEKELLQAEADKAATPAERLWSEKDLARDMERARPQSLVLQRDSDAN